MSKQESFLAHLAIVDFGGSGHCYRIYARDLLTREKYSFNIGNFIEVIINRGVSDGIIPQSSYIKVPSRTWRDDGETIKLDKSQIKKSKFNLKEESEGHDIE